jgi:tryptophan synthase alpha chain
MTRFDEIFAAARRERRAALIPYLTVGDPSLPASLEIALALADAGADIIELGVPFSDPVADGPVIQAASQRALAHGVCLEDALQLARQLRQRSPVGLLLFSYYNPILQYAATRRRPERQRASVAGERSTAPARPAGGRRQQKVAVPHGLPTFARNAVAAGCDGVLATDLIPEEAADYRRAALAAGLDTVFLAAPTSPDLRLAAIGEASRGFVYAVSRLGVTGARATVAPGARELVERLRRQTPLPIALGFGISQPEQARAVARFADGVVVGTALVETIARAPHGEAPAAAAAFLRRLRKACELG